jgi:hypothetical protein
MKTKPQRQKVLNEIEKIPDARLDDLFDLLHSFRINYATGAKSTAPVMQFQGLGPTSRTRTLPTCLPTSPRAAETHSHGGADLKEARIDTDILSFFLRGAT